MVHGAGPGGMAVARPGGAIGRWTTGPDGEDAFALDPPAGTGPDGSPERMWHQLGNAAITATAHAGGWLELWSTARGMVRLTGAPGGWGPVGAGRRSIRATWGAGEAIWDATFAPPGAPTGDGSVAVTRRVRTPRADRPWLLVEVEVRAHGTGLPAWWEEHLVPDVDHLLLGALMSPAVPPPPGYRWRDRLVWRGLYGLSGSVRAATLLARRAVSRSLLRPPTFRRPWRAVVSCPRFPVDPSHDAEAAPVDRSLPAVAVVALDPGREVAGDGGRLWVRCSAAERAAGRAVLRFAVVLAEAEADVPALATEAAAAGPADLDWSSLLALHLPDAPWLERETRWHAAYLLGARQHDAHFGRAYVSQGSAYAFAHGLHGAPRDYAIFSVPLAHIDPAAARAMVEVILGLSRPSGALYYAHFGRGQVSSGGIHAAPTDLPLFLLWAAAEYVAATGDVGLLDAPVPGGGPQGGSVAERLVATWRYLRDRVGLGPHGLLRVGSGDWNDPISAMVPDRAAFHDRGESMFNTAMACAVLPMAADLLAGHAPDDAAGMRAVASDLRRAAEDTAWTGRWFLRGFDGRGGPVGEEHLFLDANAWALIADLGSAADGRTLAAEIGTRCDDPSPIGATILDRPHPVRFGMLAPGWDCNGGVWAAVNAFLAWGYARHDPERAWRSLAQQSLAAHATAYPDRWLGVWSGPDAYNAHFGSEPGGTFVQPATPMAEFPIMNANAHAGPLLALLKVLGIGLGTAGPMGSTIPAPWELRTALGAFGGDAAMPD